MSRGCEIQHTTPIPLRLALGKYIDAAREFELLFLEFLQNLLRYIHMIDLILTPRGIDVLSKSLHRMQMIELFKGKVLVNLLLIARISSQFNGNQALVLAQ